MVPPKTVVVVSQDWPEWLPVVLSMKIPAKGHYFPEVYHKFFKPALTNSSEGFCTLIEFEGSTSHANIIVCVSGMVEFLETELLYKHNLHFLDHVLFALDVDFGPSPQRMFDHLRSCCSALQNLA